MRKVSAGICTTDSDYTVGGVLIAGNGNLTNRVKTILSNGLSIKDVRNQIGREIVQCGHFSDKGNSSDADVCTFWCKKLRIFFEIYGVSARTREGWASADILQIRKGEVQFLTILCGRLLWTVPKIICVDIEGNFIIYLNFCRYRASLVRNSIPKQR